ncbi:DsbA family oxidoreductase [Cohnella candidum]|uniref:DsbA family oxidoreductase n=1 Tax=Cohnella candidum TaxID=2674991 RepID=A0A3G3K2H4_9BACL|nr:DsbA family oxidoreductase [Cohnella candidum]AYQ74257.1 DsbA family oxidoreductase [Cohnella candidum]
MRIDLYSDMVCPWCRIGKKNMYDAIMAWASEVNETIPVTFHAYQLDPSVPPEGKLFRQDMEAKFGGAERLDPMLQRVTDAGADVGLTFRFDKVTRMPNTLLAHRITAIVPADRQQEWVNAAMDAYFEEGRDLAQPEVLLELAAGIGLDAEDIRRRLDAGEGIQETEQDFETARNMGITGVPFFVINGKYALSGAYPAAQFLAAFRKISQQENA